VDDAERLSQDPTFRLIGSEKIWESGAALPSRLHWFETEVLSQDGYLRRLQKRKSEIKPVLQRSVSRPRDCYSCRSRLAGGEPGRPGPAGPFDFAQGRLARRPSLRIRNERPRTFLHSEPRYIEPRT
jgi:hypothetical protein